MKSFRGFLPGRDISSMQNSMSRKRCIYLLSAVAALVLVGCSSHKDLDSSAPNQEGRETAVSFELSAEMPESLTDSEARAMAYDVTNSGAKLNMSEEAMSSVVVIANAAKTNVYYASVTWEKVPNKNTLRYRGKMTNLDSGQELKLSASETWYMMGYVGGEYAHATKQVKYAPNDQALQAVSIGGNIVKKVPVFFPWTELTSKRHADGSVSLQAFDVKFRSLGMLMRIELKNEAAYSVRYKNIYVNSNALKTGAGYFDLSVAGLPATTASTPTAWTMSGTEPKYSFLDETGGGSLDVVLPSGDTYAKNFLLWAMPEPTQPTYPRTHLLANAVRLSVAGIEQSEPRMNSVYVWGSASKITSTKQRYLLKTRLVRDKLALEYFAKNYVNTSFNVATTTPYSTYNGTSLFTYETASQPGFLTSGWHVPSYNEAMAMFMPYGSELTFGGGRVSDLSRDVTINGVTQTFYDAYAMPPSSNVIYGLRLDDKGGRKQYSAWRYTYDKTSGIKVECVFLGPNFKGDDFDIRQPEFWQLHVNDIIQRSYPVSVSRVIDPRMPSTSVYGSPFWAIGQPAGETGRQFHWFFGTPLDDQGTFGMTFFRHVVTGTNVPARAITSVLPLENTGTPFEEN